MAVEMRSTEQTGVERRESCEMKRFVLEGIDRLRVKGGGFITVLRGKVDGELQAIVLGQDRPLELLMAESTAGAKSILNRLSK